MILLPLIFVCAHLTLIEICLAKVHPLKPTDSLFSQVIPEKKNDGYTIGVSVKRVMLDVTVRDRKGRYINNLKKKHFQVYENGVRQQIDFFSNRTNKPVSIVFLLDVSGSMDIGKKFKLAKSALRHITRSLRPRDEFTVYLFADEGYEIMASFQNDKKNLFQRLEHVKAYGKTALLDMLAIAPGFIQDAHNPRKLIIVLSDGVDNYSKLTLKTALEHMRKLQVPLYSFAIKNLPGKYYKQDEFSEDLLKMCSRETGGEFFLVSTAQDFRYACRSLLKAMRSSYSIGYKSTNNKNDGKFRRIKIILKKKKLIAYYRKGYYPL